VGSHSFLLPIQFDGLLEILSGWPHFVVAGVAVPIVVGVLARKVVPTLFSALLSLLSLTLFFEPSSTGPALAVASAIGSFLIALQSLIERRRTTALNTQIGELTARLVDLEAAESRRQAVELRKKARRGRFKTSSATPDTRPTPSLSVVRSEFAPTTET
jgi:hypothetical protein